MRIDALMCIVPSASSIRFRWDSRGHNTTQAAACATFSNNAAKQKSKSTMKKFFVILPLALSIFFVACQRQQTEDERRAEIDREVEQRLAAERQQQQDQQLSQREAELNAREQSLSEKEKQPTTPGRSRDRVVRESVTTAEEGQSTGSYSMFYTRLEPYGDWIETRDYGYVYRPREATSARWRPYVNGHWVYTDAGWTWISDEPFGWATYHYGRWTRIRNVGWVWVPGEEWAPAWVSWRKGSDYCGWAPLPPEARFDRRTGIRNWSDSYYDIGPDQYVFVPTRQLGEERVERAIVPEQRNVAIISQTTNVTNISYNNTIITNQGPSYEELRTLTPIKRLRLERQSNVQANEARAIVRGDVVEIPAPVIAPARPSERPRTIKETIGQATVDLGWAAINNQREAEQARAKIKSEATPPRDAPPKSFVRATEASSAAATTPSTTPTATSPTATSAPTSPPPTAERSTPIPQPTFTPRATAAAPITAPTAPPGSTEAPHATASPAAPTSPSNRGAVGEPQATATPSSPTPVRERGKLKSVARELEKQGTVPMRSPAISPRAGENATPLPTSTPITAPSVVPRATGTPTPSASVATDTSPAVPGTASGVMPEQEKRGKTRAFRPGVTPEVSASPAGTTTPAEGASDNEAKRDRRARGKQTGPSPSNSPSPGGGQ